MKKTILIEVEVSIEVGDIIVTNEGVEARVVHVTESCIVAQVFGYDIPMIFDANTLNAVNIIRGDLDQRSDTFWINLEATYQLKKETF